MKPGDIVVIFGSPIKCESPIGQARLHKKISDLGAVEEWLVEYLDQEEQLYNALIKKTDGTSTSQ